MSCVQILFHVHHIIPPHFLQHAPAILHKTCPNAASCASRHSPAFLQHAPTYEQYCDCACAQCIHAQAARCDCDCACVHVVRCDFFSHLMPCPWLAQSTLHQRPNLKRHAWLAKADSESFMSNRGRFLPNKKIVSVSCLHMTACHAMPRKTIIPMSTPASRVPTRDARCLQA